MPTDHAPPLAQLPPEEAIRRIAKARELILDEVHKVVVGQSELLELLLVGLFSQGHCLAVGAPGLAKSLAVETLARTMQLSFHRASLTPDMTPEDLVGRETLEEDPATKQRVRRATPGPIFANVLLADEIQAAPPRTQAALLDAMHDHQVQIGESRLELEAPFFVLATHNPAEMAGVHPLHEAHLDRFMLSIQLRYPSRDEERQMVAASTRAGQPEVKPLLRPRDILWIQQWVRQIPVSEPLVAYAVDLARATRPAEQDAPELTKRWLAWGAGPRAAQSLVLAAKTRALIKGRAAVHSADIRWAVKPVLSHRLQLNAAARLAHVTLDQFLDHLLHSVRDPAPTRPILELPP
ncbi:MAG: MoxR family ATPase [Pirellulales bacterium]